MGSALNRRCLSWGSAGAERLIVDAAVELAGHGHKVRRPTGSSDAGAVVVISRAVACTKYTQGPRTHRHVHARLLLLPSFLRHPCSFLPPTSCLTSPPPTLQVDVYTACHDPTRCFAETVGGPFSVTVAGGWFPRALAGRCMALCAYVRCALVALHIAWRCWVQRRQYDVIIVDQVAAVVPLLRALTSARVLFYCHFPDLLLATRRSRLHSAYRAPLDWLEQQATGASHALLVNSRFTQGEAVQWGPAAAAASAASAAAVCRPCACPPAFHPPVPAHAPAPTSPPRRLCRHLQAP